MPILAKVVFRWPAFAALLLDKIIGLRVNNVPVGVSLCVSWCYGGVNIDKDVMKKEENMRSKVNQKLSKETGLIAKFAVLMTCKTLYSILPGTRVGRSKVVLGFTMDSRSYVSTS